MKKRSVIAAAVALVLVLSLTVLAVSARPLWLGFKPNIEAQAAVLMEMETGQVKIRLNADTPLPPASLTKLMTEMVILDQISAGRAGWNEQVAVSAYASSVGGTTLSLKRGELYTVRELFDGIAIYAANDAAVALAEHIAGSESAFVRLMNEKARSLGLSAATVFHNASGLMQNDLGPNRPADLGREETVMTAMDTAKLARALISAHPELLDTVSRTQMELKGKGLYVSNTNLMLPAMGGSYAYEGTDGLRTAYNSRIGYSFTGTAKRNGHRMIAVVIGSPTGEARFSSAARMFDYGFLQHLPAGRRMLRMAEMMAGG